MLRNGSINKGAIAGPHLARTSHINSRVVGGRVFYPVRPRLYNSPRGGVTKFCSQQTEVIQNHENEHVRSTGQGEARHTKYKTL
jgi:hypothetical protein